MFFLQTLAVMETDIQLRTTWSGHADGQVKHLFSTVSSLVVVKASSKVLVLDYENSKAKREFQIQQHDITSATISSKGSELIVGCEDGFLRWWHLETGEETCSTQVPRDTSDADAAAASSQAVSIVSCSKKSSLAAVCGR